MGVSSGTGYRVIVSVSSISPSGIWGEQASSWTCRFVVEVAPPKALEPGTSG